MSITVMTVAANFPDYMVAGGVAPYTWKVLSGNAPSSWKLNYTNPGESVKVSITPPTTLGTYTFTVRVTDKNGAFADDTRTVTVSRPSVNGSFPEGAIVGDYYSGSLTASGGTAPYKWSVSSGKIPEGMSYTAGGTRFTLMGTPRKAGTYTFAVTVTDKYGARPANPRQFTVTATKTTITSGSSSSGVASVSAAVQQHTIARGASFSLGYSVYGGKAPYDWSGSLPAGLTLNKSTGKITGKPTKAGSYTFSLKVVDKNGVVATKTYTVKITQTAITGAFTAAGVVKAKYSSTITATGGTAGYTWTKTSGTIPAGLKLTYSGAKATLSGTPTKAGTYTFSLKVADKNGAAVTKKFTVKIVEAKASAKVYSETGIISQYAKAVTGQVQTVGAAPQTTASPQTQTELTGTGNTAVNLPAIIEVVSDDIIEAYDGRDSDIVKVRADSPVRFIVSNWGAKVSGVTVCVDDKPADSITVSDEGMFTLPAEFVYGDFKVSAKAQSEAGELESEELYVIAE